MQDIGQILNEILPKKEYLKPIPTYASRLPDAVVQLTVVTTCDNCGTVFRSPNTKLLYRFGRDLVGTSDARLFLKHESREWEVKTPACECCWKGE